VRLGGEHPRQDAERRPDRLLREHASGDRLGTGCDGGPWPAVSYDQHGNQLRWDITRFEYDFLDVLRRSYDQVGVDIVRDHSYLYTADDERIATIEIPTTPFGKLIETWRLRDLDDRILREYTYNRSQDRWTWQKDWIHGAGRLLSTHDRDSGELRHASLDHLGNTRLLTGNGGNLIARYDYYPHGDPIEPITNESEVLRFTGHERDSRGMGGAAGYGALNYMHARYQSPYLGRFLTVDPVESGIPSKPQSWHKYAYARGNPLKYVDPNGKDPIQFQQIGRTKALTKFLVRLAQRPGGRAALTRIAERQGFKATVSDARLNDIAALRSQQARGSDIAFTGGDTAAQELQGPDGSRTVTGADIRIDTLAVEQLHHDRSGVVTSGHEIAGHTGDLLDGMLPGQTAAREAEPKLSANRFWTSLSTLTRTKLSSFFKRCLTASLGSRRGKTNATLSDQSCRKVTSSLRDRCCGNRVLSGSQD
jgi:RHS repeat-associated protein